jgi:hypothetical protein
MGRKFTDGPLRVYEDLMQQVPRHWSGYNDEDEEPPKRRRKRRHKRRYPKHYKRSKRYDGFGGDLDEDGGDGAETAI